MIPTIKIERKESNLNILICAKIDTLVSFKVNNSELYRLKHALDEGLDYEVNQYEKTVNKWMKYDSHKNNIHVFSENKGVKSQFSIIIKLSKNKREALIRLIDNVLMILAPHGYLHEDYVKYRHNIDRFEILRQVEKKDIHTKNEIKNGRLNILVDRATLERYVNRKNQNFIR